MPCLNEAETLAICIEKGLRFLKKEAIDGEVLIADNGSTDGSQQIATACGARVVPVQEKGYGSALRGGIEQARGHYIIMGDADDSYDFSNLMPFVAKLRAGYDLVMGNRFKGGIAKGAMPFLHKYLGNPVLTFIGKVFFGSPANDFHCGLRGFSKAAYQQMTLVTTGMEFASEMVIKSTLRHLKIAEVPTTLSVDGRSRPPHLQTWRDGWRHLRFMLLYSPRWLFFIPGLTLMLLGLLASTLLIFSTEIKFLGASLDVHTLLYTMSAIILGYQLLFMGVFTQRFAKSHQILLGKGWTGDRFKGISLEKGVILGALLLAAGIFLGVYAIRYWSTTAFGSLDPSTGLRIVVPSAGFIIIGFQTIFYSFFIGVLDIKTIRN